MFTVLTLWTIKLPFGVQLPGRTHTAVWKEPVSQADSWLCSQLSLPCDLSHHPHAPSPILERHRSIPALQPMERWQNPAATCTAPTAAGIQRLSGAVP